MSATRLPYLRIDTSTAGLTIPLVRGLVPPSQSSEMPNYSLGHMGSPHCQDLCKPYFNRGPLISKRLIGLRDDSVPFIILQMNKIIPWGAGGEEGEMTCPRSNRVLMAKLGVDSLSYAPALTLSRQSTLPGLMEIKTAVRKYDTDPALK